MKKVTAAEIQELDRQATKKYGIPSLTLMENAGKGVADFICQKMTGKKVLVLSGTGNNGGDGFVVARFLHQTGHKVSVFMLGDPAKMTAETKTNLERLSQLKVSGELLTPSTFPTFESQLESSDVVVDALFGVGLSRPLEDLYAEAVDHVNSTGSQVVAVDIPSGLHADSGEVLGHAVFANHTLTMGFAKWGLFKAEGPERSGKIHIVDIGFPAELMKD